MKRKRAAAKVAAKETQRKEKKNETNNCNVDAPASSVDNTSRIQVCATTGLPLQSPYYQLADESLPRSSKDTYAAEVAKLILNTSMESILHGMKDVPPTDFNRILTFCKEVYSNFFFKSFCFQPSFQCAPYINNELSS